MVDSAVRAITLALLFAAFALPSLPQESAPAEPAPKAEPKLPLGAFQWRALGPAMMSGRIAEIAVHPQKKATWYAAVASGGVWRTRNAGLTWDPIFDGEKSFSIGALTIDPHNPDRIWVGTGENNSQRSVGYGDGLYRSDDGGKSWRHLGLAESEHIAKILVHPHDPNIIYVAAQGPLWAPGGDRGLYKSTDGGETFTAVLQIDEHTGVTDMVMDENNPDCLLVATYQRRRHVWTLINGGPGSGLHRTEDGGQTWKKITRGLPGAELGRIGLANAKTNPRRVYAIVEAQFGEGGFYASDDFGQSFARKSDRVSPSPQYYQELVVDPTNAERVYSLETYLQRSDDGGRTWFAYPEDRKHVDNHALWIDPENPDHFIAGCDGGVYETYDLGQTFDFKASLPITQFYRVTADDDLPFYNVYGGTQDNATQGGPSRTRNVRGIRNADWFVTVFGDGFETVIEAGNPDIVYSQWQYGGLVRYDRRTGETLDIQPQVGPEEDPLRWNWNSPLLASVHVRERIYYAAQRLFKSDDRGSSWQPISGDLSRGKDRNALPVMGRVHSIDAVAKNNSTSFYGSIVSLAESPLDQNLLYAGCDDGMIQVTEDGGQNWRKIEAIDGVPELAYCSDLEASRHDADVVYATFHHYKSGDFKPYVMKSEDRGLTWTMISANLPERGSVYTFAEDHLDPNLLFVGTEFSVFVTIDGGAHWHKLSRGLPPIAVRDLDIQRREDDLVIATFGRGIYILDDYSALRHLGEESEAPVRLFPIRRAYSYIPMRDSDTRYQGHGHWTAKNPDFGALFTYEVKGDYTSLKDARKKREREAVKKGEDTPYPSRDELRAEREEKKARLSFRIEDEAGAVIREISGTLSEGLHRTAYDLRATGTDPIAGGADGRKGPIGNGSAPLIPGGRYFAQPILERDGARESIGPKIPFQVTPLADGVLVARDARELMAFQQELQETHRILAAAGRKESEVQTEIGQLFAALSRMPKAPPELAETLRRLDQDLTAIRIALRGDPLFSDLEEAAHPGLLERLSRVRNASFNSTSAPTATHRSELERVRALSAPVLAELEALRETDLPAIREAFDRAGAPWTPGR